MSDFERDYVETRFGEKLFTSFEDFFDVLNDVFRRNPKDIIRLETNVDDSIISTKDLSLVTLYEIRGVRQVTSNKDIGLMAEKIEHLLKSFMTNPGHYMQFVMEFDPEMAESEVSRNIDMMKQTSRKTGLSLDYILDDWQSKLKNWVSYERVYVAIWTRPDVLTKHNLGQSKEDQRKRVLSSIYSRNAMNIESYLKDMINFQKGFQTSLEEGFLSAKVSIKRLNCHEALRVMRGQIDKEATGNHWSPFLNGDKMMIKVKNKLDNLRDYENIMYPKIASQIVPREFEDQNHQMTMVGEKLHHPLILKVPGEPEYFDSLFSKLVNKNFGWRLSFGINGGSPTFGIKGFLSGIFKKTSNSNYLLTDALVYLDNLRKKGVAVTTFKASFDTWVNAYEEDAVKKLKSQASELMTAIQSWGGAEVSDIIGHPTLGVLSTVAGLTDSIPSEGAGAPLVDAISMMPYSRPASVWDTGSTLFRTACGKIFPYEQGSSKQTAWIDIGLAPMGFGKSVSLNVLNFTFVFNSSLKELPWLSILDIGPSSKGMVDLIRMGLSEERRHLAVYHRLRMSPEESINVCDTMLGLRYPIKSHKSFLQNLLVLFGTPEDGSESPIGLSDIAGRAIDLAYQKFDDDNNPKLYKEGTYFDVDRRLKELNYPFDSDTTWWEVVDFLFDHKEEYLSSKSQRQAVPLIQEIASMFSHHVIEKLYGDSEYKGDKVIRYFWNACIGAINNYDILSAPTRLDLSESRIVSLDLDEVANTSPRQTAVMYMVARQLVGAKLFLSAKDIPDIENKGLKNYHLSRVRSIQNDPKRISYDEIHRITGSKAQRSAVNQIVTDIRESRKWKLHVGLYSQKIKDFPEEIRSLATSVYIFGAGDESDINDLTDVYSLTPAEQTEIRHINKPGVAGSSFLSIMKTEVGEIRLKLFNTVGSLMLWGFSSTREDNTLREMLQDSMEHEVMFKLLAKKFPSGTVKNEKEKRENYYLERSESVDVLEQIADEIIEESRRF